jgi:hypothetical protein
MTTRLDLTLQKHPTQEANIRLLAARDPSGNLKYLDWGAKILASGQALAGEIADVLDLFHLFAGRRANPVARGSRRASIAIHTDIYSYQPEDLAGLRDDLLKLKRVQDRKRKKRERLYHIEGSVEADVVYDAPDLIVRHIKNKPASVHYGLSTKWCISMLREGYFEDYEAQNATFFFFERKVPVGDEFDKVALMLSRNSSREEESCAFTSVDRRVDMMVLAKVHGPRVFEIFREIYERSERYPGSALFRIYDGHAPKEQLESVFASLVSRDLKLNSSYETDSLLESICCNPEAPLALLEEIKKRAPKLSLAAWKRSHGRRRGSMRIRRHRHSTKELECVIASALFLHHTVPPDLRMKIGKELRRKKVNTNNIHQTKDGGRVGVSYLPVHKRIFAVRRRRRQRTTPIALRAYARVLEKKLARTQKAIVKAEAAKAKKEGK